MTTQTHCFYHSADLDGKCSGAIVKRTIPWVIMHGIDYGDEFPWEEIDGHNVILVDFSLCWEDMELLSKMSTHFTWIDHHKTAIDQYEKLATIDLAGVRKVGKAACELAWEYYFPKEPMPFGVWLLGRYDVWDHTADPRILPFQYGMKLYNWDPSREEWSAIFSGEAFTYNTCRLGETIIAYRENEAKDYCEHFAFDTSLRGEGYKCIAVNRSFIDSLFFDSVSDKYDIMIPFVWTGKRWRVSLYTAKDIDVGEIARTYGGGGHKQAAGFKCEVLPFTSKP